MNDTLLKNWNDKISKDDIVYHLGDIVLYNNINLVRDFIYSLNGNIILIKGSHDKSVLNEKCKNRFQEIVTTKSITIEQQIVFMAHHCHKVWDKSHYDSWHLFGHSHGGLDEYSKNEGKLLDVGVDSHNFTPLSWDEIKQIMETRPLNFNSLQRRK
jgi:calcineurin-like phosphoesterase family protein